MSYGTKVTIYHTFLSHSSEKKEKNSIILKNVELTQSEERLKQQLRSESNEINDMNETIQSLTEQRNEIECRLNDYHQQIERIDDLKNEIGEKNKVNSYLNHFAR